jgi:hypothetical protein
MSERKRNYWSEFIVLFKFWLPLAPTPPSRTTGATVGAGAGAGGIGALSHCWYMFGMFGSSVYW